MEGELRDAAAYVESILPPPITDGPVLAEWFYRPSTQLAGDAFGYQMLDDAALRCLRAGRIGARHRPGAVFGVGGQRAAPASAAGGRFP